MKDDDAYVTYLALIITFMFGYVLIARMYSNQIGGGLNVGTGTKTSRSGK